MLKMNLANTSHNTSKHHSHFIQKMYKIECTFANQTLVFSLVGHWVFLANCHLSLSWMCELDKLVEEFQVQECHPDFRLWLSSSPHPEFPIAILQTGIKITTEPPRVHACTSSTVGRCWK